MLAFMTIKSPNSVEHLIMARTAPNERIHIRYTPHRNNPEKTSVELPLKLLAIGNFIGDNYSQYSLEKRQSVNINNQTFTDVMASMNINIDITVANHLSHTSTEPQTPQNLNVHLPIRSLSDFHPDAIIANTPELYQQMIFRDLLYTLRQSSPQKAPMILSAIAQFLLRHPTLIPPPITYARTR